MTRVELRDVNRKDLFVKKVKDAVTSMFILLSTHTVSLFFMKLKNLECDCINLFSHIEFHAGFVSFCFHFV